MRRLLHKRGFSLIELLIVMVIIGVLAAVAIPTYLGFQNKARRAAVIKSAESSVSEIQAWLQSSLSPNVNNREADTNFDGIVNDPDKTNTELLNYGVAATYMEGKNNILKEKSPWDPSTQLWSTDSSMPKGRISLIQMSNYKIKVVAKDKEGNIIFEKFIFAD